ncbi:MAG: hypothetical protein QOE95_2462 [Gaiellaceae bacterium]|nr:hypothetical protein [Gaiellaceae bacterium]
MRTRAGAIGVLAAAVIAAIGLVRSHSANTNVPTTPPTAVNVQALAGLVSGQPPWPAETEQLRARLDAIGVPARAGLTLHVHQHLDVFVNGKQVVVPAGIGIGDGLLSPLHTHDESGVIHVESTTVRSYSLGELFAVWGVRLTKTCLADECGDGKLHLFVNGKPKADPNRIVLSQHLEIAVAFGSPPKPVPSSYGF